jgi:hypothetical protein
MTQYATPPSRLSTRAILLWSLAAAAAIEALTLVLRFGSSLESTQDTVWLAALTGGLRIHHGYIGMFCLMGATLAWDRLRRTSPWAVVLGLALLVSDLVHHFLVLWPITGSPQFDLIYPGFW